MHGCLLHVSQRLAICNWQIRSAENKNKTEIRKQEIKEKLKKTGSHSRQTQVRIWKQ